MNFNSIKQRLGFSTLVVLAVLTPLLLAALVPLIAAIGLR